MHIFTDFCSHKPLVIDGNVKAIDLEKLMKQAHVKMKVVLDKEKKFVGIISLNDLSEENFLKRIDKNNRRDDFLVSDFMHKRETLLCFDFDELNNATVGDVLTTQKSNKQQHCLVLDRVKHQIRGLISARDIARALRKTVDVQDHVSFEDLFNETFS